jgi:hypothetical protein
MRFIRLFDRPRHRDRHGQRCAFEIHDPNGGDDVPQMAYGEVEVEADIGQKDRRERPVQERILSCYKVPHHSWFLCIAV